ncbi:putative 26S proteasome regulatory subunit [Friedmanniomyces endolithicus]|uniref:Probable 26S proteasome regulatory subunit p27 n=1 Tax=Friedmanniomyces endolithicus TaxID=329885 RepID=A0AAN6FA22_9PEZI|nr:putative 26S proteasome regulatory subunit [Friedmanniomyces endolithicus]KAK0268110.1 putative 26S proteasome regulatory subunit [Friedmanniomyces endolithicus]KAK0275826.1 putative 26S proteasome regulatory subunit [Friedmanniomyces endolithicus]KAK0307835.1 putative 26S proteasome regulatory subunit [Friedmanniomyces endolithicus]KAK0311889.1 putative 26S proteasome regulatory subunit [Friedmanniomyces endolithicus]
MPDLHAPTVASGPTSQNAASGTERKLTLPQLMAKKEDLEAELSALGSVLDSTGPAVAHQLMRRRQHKVTMTTPLLTPDGFPRADIDVAQIRTTRARIIRLKNDYKSAMSKLEVAVQEQFASGKALDVAQPARSQASTNGANAESGSSRGAVIEPPFAKVNSVVPNSPAEEAGLRAGDKITRFGGANWTNHERLSKVAQVVQQNENQLILVKVLRERGPLTGSATLELQLTPRRDWGGRGLLGCHLLPL